MYEKIIGLAVLLFCSLVLWGLSKIFKWQEKWEAREPEPREESDREKDGPMKRYLNDDKLTRRWQTAKSIKNVNEGKTEIKNGEDRFHLTPRDQDPE